MAKKNEPNFTTFFSGIVEIAGEKYNFGTGGLSYKRHYAAKSAGVTIARVIKIPEVRYFHPNSLVTINNEKYVIEMVQPVPDGTPPHTVLTLTEYEVNRR
jgi:hypothetical protein